MCINVYQVMKNQGLGPYNSQCHADNRKYFLSLSLSLSLSNTKSKGLANVSLSEGSAKNLEMLFLRKR